MRHTVHLLHVAEDQRLAAIRALRDAVRTLPGSETFKAREADAMIEDVIGGQAVLLFSTPNPAEARKFAERCEVGMLLVVGLDLSPEAQLGNPPAQMTPERPVAAPVAPSDPPEAPVWSPEVYETAMALLCMTEGNPLVAAARSVLLRNTTQDLDLYAEVQDCLVGVFPFIEASLVASELREGA